MPGLSALCQAPKLRHMAHLIAHSNSDRGQSSTDFDRFFGGVCVFPLSFFYPGAA
jgi:hypothetical protein